MDPRNRSQASGPGSGRWEAPVGPPIVHHCGGRYADVGPRGVGPDLRASTYSSDSGFVQQFGRV